MDVKEIRIVDLRQSRGKGTIWSLCVTATLFLTLFVPGLLADSAAMQWAGFLVLLVSLFLMMLGFNAKKMTIDQARAELDKLEAK